VFSSVGYGAKDGIPWLGCIHGRCGWNSRTCERRVGNAIAAQNYGRDDNDNSNYPPPPLPPYHRLPAVYRRVRYVPRAVDGVRLMHLICRWRQKNSKNGREMGFRATNFG
jgi:hypothetical protein